MRTNENSSITLFLLVGCGGSGSDPVVVTPPPTNPPPTNPPPTNPPPTDPTEDYTVPTGDLVAWARKVSNAGFECSATHCDLDNDGKLEGIVPVAVVDHPELSYMMVLEGQSGDIRWQSEMGSGGYAYPLCVDVNADGVLDVITGGRTRDIQGLSGVDGQQLWRFAQINPDVLEGNTHAPVAETANPSTFFFATGGGGGGGGNRLWWRTLPAICMLFNWHGRPVRRYWTIFVECYQRRQWHSYFA
jgi:hypothetical protein